MNMHCCQEIQDALIDYINRRLDQPECCRIAVHLSECKACRDEVAFLIKIGRHCCGQAEDVPADMLESAFDKIPNTAGKYRFLDCLEPVYDSLQITCKTLRFAAQFI
jgi:anti-sigma factor ChrR (cupin superfamily)